MDSVTHLFYGGVIAAAIAPRAHRRAALLAGMALNTLPDLDVIPLKLFADPVAEMTCHRGVTHSMLLLPFVAWALWAWFKRRGGRVAEAPRRWFCSEAAAMILMEVGKLPNYYEKPKEWYSPERLAQALGV